MNFNQRNEEKMELVNKVLEMFIKEGDKGAMIVYELKKCTDLLHGIAGPHHDDKVNDEVLAFVVDLKNKITEFSNKLKEEMK